MRTLQLWLTFLLLLSIASLCSGGNITYAVNQTIGVGGVTGVITTDGKIGTLAGNDISGFNLFVSDGAYPPFNLVGVVPFNLFLTGSDLSATASQLLFNFSGADDGVFGMLHPSGDFGVCFVAGAPGGCFTAIAPGPGAALVYLTPSFTIDQLHSSLSGTQAIGASGSALFSFQGAGPGSPVLLPNGPVAEVTGMIGGLGSTDYYSFNWAGGAFSATASVAGANTGAAYLFSDGVAGSCSSGGSATLNGGDNFTGTIATANLAPGQYCIGINANSPNDPAFTLIFNTPVTGSQTPEPSSFVLLSVGLGIISMVRLKKRAQEESLIRP